VEKGSEDLVVTMKSVKMNTSCKMHCVLQCINNKAVPEIHFVALLKLEVPVCTISVESAHGALVQEWSMSTHLAHILPSAEPSMIH